MKNLNNYNKNFWNNQGDKILDFLKNHKNKENFVIDFALLTQNERLKLSNVFDYATHANVDLIYLLAYLPIDVFFFILSDLFDESPTLVLDLIIYSKFNKSIYSDIFLSRHYHLKNNNLLKIVYKNDIFFSEINDLI